MSRLANALRNRLLPAVLTATGVSLLAAGLLTYSAPVEAGPDPNASSDIALGSPNPSLDLPTFPPASGSTSPSPSEPAPADRVATRVVIPALKIDLPVVKPVGGAGAYPQCNVAMYLTDLHQPGQGMATYIYAHARDGMFGPIWNLAIRLAKPQKLLGLVVEVYTSDDQRFIYEVKDVKLHQRTLDDVGQSGSEELWLQTSEGPNASYPKTQLLALPIGVLPATHAAAHPTPHPVNCA